MTNDYNKISWSLYNGALVPDAPPHHEIKLSKKEAKELLRKSKAYLLRWPSDFDCGHETGWWYLIRDKGICLEEFKSKIRKQILKGLANCIVKKVDAEFIAQNGYEVYKSAFSSYDTFMKPVEEEEFQQRMRARKDNPIYDFWAAFCKEDQKVIAYFMNRVDSEYCMYSTGKFRPEYLKINVHQALVYEMTNYYLCELGLKYVCAGARSISHKTNVQDFLERKLHFRKAYCKLNVLYKGGLRLIIEILYPFRNIISKIDTNFTNKITVLMRQETMRRSFLPV